MKEELTRLQTQAEEFSSSTEESMMKLGIKPDMKVVDIGCGTGSVSFMISPMVGELGRVVGVDSNQYAINYCNEIAQGNGILNTKFMISDATNLDFESHIFDVSYSRFLFQHLKAASEALREMVRITKPGGLVMVEDCDLFTWLVYPKNESVSKLWHWYESIQIERGTDPEIGRKLYAMFLDEGLEPSVDVYSKSVYLNRDAFWKSITAVLEKIDSEELKSLISGIEEFAMTSNSLFVFPLVFRVWARIK
ncbi:MAG: methyltransferase domain-containing protein [Nitrososphaeraceae archaeon]